MSRTARWPLFILFFGMGSFAGASIMALVIVGDEELRAANDRLQTAKQQHILEVAELSNENWMLAEENRTLEDHVADLEFAIGHAAVQLQADKGQAPAYDMERFLARNPEARKYFPYLLDAVERYSHIWQVDPMFALAILKQESDFGRHIVSYAGALGDAQFIASTGERYGLDAREPYAWVAGRRSFSRAAEERREARYARNRFLANVEVDLSGSSSEVRARLEKKVVRNLDYLREYFERLETADELQRKGKTAFKDYQREIQLALDHARDLERDVRARQRREEELIRVTGIRAPKTRAERDAEVQLIVNDYLATVDERLSPMLLTDALVHHLADLNEEFSGDPRLVASRYNASRRAMEAAVASVGGGVGIPLLDETQNYVNRVVAYRAFFAVDGGIVDNNFGIRYARR